MNFWRFADPAAGAGPLLVGEYDPVLVMLSIALASLSGITALQISARIGDADSASARRWWLAAGAMAMGGGIWSMHFTAMLAYKLEIPMHYDLRITVASLLPSVVGSAAALYCQSRPGLRLADWNLHLSALLMALGIGTMHYLGMEAMNMPAQMVYDPLYFALSIVVAYLLAMVAILIRAALERTLSRDSGAGAVVGGILMGLAVAGMHYTAMYAASFYNLPDSSSSHEGVSHIVMAAAISGTVFLVLSLTLLVAWADNFRQMTQLQSSSNTVTGLHNRTHFAEQLNATMAALLIHKQPVALVMVGLYDALIEGDSTPQPISNEILHQCAQRLRDHLGPNAILGHFIGHEFAILLRGEQEASPENAAALTESIVQRLKAPLTIARQNAALDASAGLVIETSHARQAEPMIIEARTAMLVARQKRKSFCLYSPGLSELIGDESSPAWQANYH